ncbi:MAG: hypothetical protein A2X49_12405 [Lentisphaerae bacterium GWF2_52_8]|nr:MAG: hypothetical protein A2X49_12405 [Lentisphaerae bacterium GWF2_52_8]
MKKILIAEDETLIRNLLKKLLETEGYIVIQASNGQMAFDMLEANPDIAMLITDIIMPKMDGRELVGRLRASKKFSSLPIIMISGAVSVKEIAELLEEGVSWFLPKPLLENEICKLIPRAFKLSAGKPPAAHPAKKSPPKQRREADKKGGRRAQHSRN